MFLRPGPTELVRRPALEATMWMRPPWAAQSVETDFELSWDITEHYFDRAARDAEWIGFFVPFVAELRRGWAATLRAGQSLTALVLSRARQHGLRVDQSYVRLAPSPDGTLTAEVNLHGKVMRREGVRPSAAGWLHDRLDELGAIRIE